MHKLARCILMMTLAIIIVISSASCAQFMAKPTPTPTPTATTTDTPTPVPTNTPLPTATPTLTNTATTADTATPDLAATSNALAATSAAISTQTADAVVAQFKTDLNKIGLAADTGQLGWIQNGPLEIKLDRAGQALYQPFAENVTASDFIFKTDVTWSSTGILVCGWIFRSEPNFEQGNLYLFNFMRFSGLPAWDIELWDKGDFVNNVTEKIRFASALDIKDGAVNTFVLSAVDNKFTVYINAERIGSFFDFSKARSNGLFAARGALESGTGSCTYKNTVIWLLK